MNDQKKPVFAITIGDPNGIGPEITLKSLNKNPDLFNQIIPVLFGDPNILQFYIKKLSLNVKIVETKEFSKLSYKPAIVFCYPVEVNQYIPLPGYITAEAGRHAFQYIIPAIELAKSGQVNGIVTAPINKKALKLAEIPYLDHTEILTKLTNSQHTMTLFVTEKLRIFFYSRHIPFRDIADDLQITKIVNSLKVCRKHLIQIGLKSPHIAVAALNPHSGESGMFGKEEIEILIPAIRKAREQNLNISGPIPADSVYHFAKEGQFDAVLSLYHDQGHIAAKTYDFFKTVSITTGLPFIRTSVDHGTAMNIAGQGIANETSMVEAIKAALKYYW